MTDPSEITGLLDQVRQGRREASDRLLDLLYDDLRAMAVRQMSGQPHGHTLQPTALVHEAYARLAAQAQGFNGREHFLAVAARAMRCVLIDHARAKGRDKRRSDGQRVELDEAIGANADRGIDLLALSDALEKLERLDARRAALVEMRFFGSLSLDQAAGLLDISPATAKREWAAAKVWLFRELTGQESADAPARHG